MNRCDQPIPCAPFLFQSRLAGQCVFSVYLDAAASRGKTLPFESTGGFLNRSAGRYLLSRLVRMSQWQYPLPLLLPSYLICLTSVARTGRPPTSDIERLKNFTGCPCVSLVCRTTNPFHSGRVNPQSNPLPSRLGLSNYFSDNILQKICVKVCMKIEKIVGLEDRAFLPNFVLEQHPGITRDLMECCVHIAKNQGLVNVSGSSRVGIPGRTTTVATEIAHRYQNVQARDLAAYAPEGWLWYPPPRL